MKAERHAKPAKRNLIAGRPSLTAVGATQGAVTKSLPGRGGNPMFSLCRSGNLRRRGQGRVKCVYEDMKVTVILVRVSVCSSIVEVRD